MIDSSSPRRPEPRQQLAERIARKQAHKQRARRTEHQSIWFGVGMFGLVGWSVAIPTVLGIALGVWIDRTWPSRFSWTLMMMIAGVAIGCLNAWRWIERERHEPDGTSEEQEHDARD